MSRPPKALSFNLGRALLAATFLGCVAASQVGLGVTSSFIPAADTSLLEVNTNNNHGGEQWFNAGTTQNGPRTRGLFRFDLSLISTQAVVRSAQVILTVVHQPRDDIADAPFGLHRMLKSWNEGNKVNEISPGQGSPASPGETTWAYRFYPTNAWAAPGGAADVDYVGAESSFQFVYGVAQSPYTFETTPELVADVQSWIAHPDQNFGWILICDAEDTIFSARRFGSRENPISPAVLEVDYLAPPTIHSIVKTKSIIQINYNEYEGQSYAVEYAGQIAGPWTLLLDRGASTNTGMVTVSDPSPLTPRFYRVRTY